MWTNNNFEPAQLVVKPCVKNGIRIPILPFHRQYCSVLLFLHLFYFGEKERYKKENYKKKEKLTTLNTKMYTKVCCIHCWNINVPL